MDKLIGSLLTVESIKGKKIPIKNTPVRGPMQADERLMVSCNTVPNFSTTNTKPVNKEQCKIWTQPGLSV